MTERTNGTIRQGKNALLHVTECSGGGVTRAVELAIRATPSIRHVVLAPEGAINADGVGARHVPLPMGTRARVHAVERLADETGAAAIHAHSSLAGAYTRLARVTVPVIYQPHCYAFSDVTKPGWMRAIYWAAERALTHRTSAVLALTAHEERQARRLGVRNVHAVVNAPTIARRRGETHGATNPTDDKTVVTIGRIAPQKDPQFFAAIAKKFGSDSSTRFVWIGDVADTDQYSSGRAALDAAGVRVTGWLGDEELRRHMMTADLYVHTAAYEGFPLSLLDACELGVPSIVRNIPALSEARLDTFDTPDEAYQMILDALRNPSTLSRLADASSDLRRRASLDAHNRSVRNAYASHALLG